MVGGGMATGPPSTTADDSRATITITYYPTTCSNYDDYPYLGMEIISRRDYIDPQDPKAVQKRYWQWLWRIFPPEPPPMNIEPRHERRTRPMRWRPPICHQRARPRFLPGRNA